MKLRTLWPKGRSLLLIDTNDLFRGILLEEAVVVVVHFLTQRVQREAFILTFGRNVRRDDGSNVVDREIGDLKFYLNPRSFQSTWALPCTIHELGSQLL